MKFVLAVFLRATVHLSFVTRQLMPPSCLPMVVVAVGRPLKRSCLRGDGQATTRREGVILDGGVSSGKTERQAPNPSVVCQSQRGAT